MTDAVVNILLLEDDPAHAEAVRRALEASDLKAVVHVAGTLREYHEAVAARPPDIALLDLVLPDGRALDVLTSLPDACPFPILIMTIYGSEQTAVEAMKAGALDYIVKSPEAFASMPHAVERALREWNVLQERKRAEAERETVLLRQEGINRLQQSLLAPVPLEQELKSITDSIVQLFDADFCRIWLIRPGDLCEQGCIHAEAREGPHLCRLRDRCLHLLASSGRYTHIDGKGHGRVPFGCYKIGRVASDEDHKSFTNDVQNDPLVHNHGWARELGLVSFVGYQLRVPGGQTMGVLALFAKRPIAPAEEAMLDGLSGTVALVVQQAEGEEALRRAEENFRNSLDDSPLGVCIVTADGTTLYANRAILKIYRYDNLEELRNTSIEKRYTPESLVGFQERRKLRRSGGLGPSEYEIAIVRKNGEVRSLRVFRKEILWDGEKRFQALYRDITEEKKRGEVLRQFEATIHGQKMLLEQQSSSVGELIDRLTHSREELAASYEALKANKDDMVRSEKLAFTGRMAAGIAHEIRNPLTNIILSLRQLKKDDKIKPEGLHYAEIMERNSKRIEYLVTELLNCACPIKLNLQPWNIHWIIEDVLRLLKVRLKTQRIKVIKNLAPHPLILLADKEYLERVFLNIVGNAIEAMPHGGALSIDTKMEKGRLLIKIQDNGKGISEKNLIRIFDPFFSTKKGGAGLGLSTCQNIVTSHGGLIEVESVWRKGAAFVVSLPLEPKPSDRRENI